MTKRFEERLTRKLKTLTNAKDEMLRMALEYAIESYIEGAVDAGGLTDTEYCEAIGRLNKVTGKEVS